MKNILLLNDMPSFGRIALQAMNPVLASRGHKVFSLPTALVSNVLDYGDFEICDTLDYMKKSLAVWDRLGFSFDAIGIGFLLGTHQADFIYELVSQKRADSSEMLVMVDPIMGDNGKLYNGIDDSRIQAMRRVCEVSNLIVPNITEACLLADMPYQEVMNESSITECITKLYDGGRRSVVITSVCLGKENAIVGYDSNKHAFFQIMYEHFPIRVPGTGDLFSAYLLGKLLEDNALETSVSRANDFIANLIKRYKDEIGNYHSIPIETYLPELLKKW